MWGKVFQKFYMHVVYVSLLLTINIYIYKVFYLIIYMIMKIIMLI